MEKMFLQEAMNAIAIGETRTALLIMLCPVYTCVLKLGRNTSRNMSRVDILDKCARWSKAADVGLKLF
jgi:hypothetical protein